MCSRVKCVGPLFVVMGIPVPSLADMLGTALFALIKQIPNYLLQSFI